MFKCPYCGVEILSEKAYWGHIEICPENPKNIKKESKEEEPIKNEEPKEDKKNKKR
ncbi:MAG: hypothetical protein GX452_04420 [Ignavibacteriales bacterium]|nr:hypothetical protein [Ignavibacteriales bacterium]